MWHPGPVVSSAAWHQPHRHHTPPHPPHSPPCVQTLETVHLLYFWWSLSKVQTVIYCCSITSAHSHNDYSLSSLPLSLLWSLSLALLHKHTHTHGWTRHTALHHARHPCFCCWHRVHPQSPVRTPVRINNVNRTPPAASTEWWLRPKASATPRPSVSHRMPLFAKTQ